MITTLPERDSLSLIFTALPSSSPLYDSMASAGDDDLDIPLEEDEPTQGPWPFSFRFDYVPQFGFGIPSPFKRLPKPRTTVRPEALGQLPGAFDQAPTRASRPTRLPTLIFLRQILRRRRLRTQTRLQAPRPPILHRRLPAMAPHLRAPILHRRALRPPILHHRLPAMAPHFELQSATAASRPWRRTFELQSATAASRPWRRTFELQSATAASRQGAAPSGSNPPPAHASGSGSQNRPPPNQRTPPTGSKRKQTDDRPNSSPRSQRRRTQNASTPKSPTTKRKKGGPKNWAIPRNAVPEEAAGLQRALHLHLRILMGLLSQRDVPTRLSADAMPLSEILAAAIPPTPSTLHFNTVANAALPYFAPDVFGNPESMYNLAHEHIAIHSFRAAAMLFAYSSIYRVTLSYVQDQHLLQRFYRSFIYGHMKTLAAKEERRPGRVELDVVLNAIYRRREETLSMRQEQIIRDCFMNGFVMKLAAERECHSDDEEADDVGVSRVHEKPGRDGAVSALFGVLDARRDAVMAQKKKKGAWRPRNRQRVLPPSNLSRALPTTVPIDYFSPKFFNDLSVWDRASYMDNGIALPLEEHCQTWEAIQQWRSLSTADFMARYGNAKLALYNIPTEDELAMLASMDEDD
ncbi:hypothetical protein B0H13DRAFT_2380014 [Mycena leptocephala]|nr:hypothetical protein B0H13DRAFT_2380014 [Mycena leptocephala]